MIDFNVYDIEISDIQESHYDLSIFSCGYEARCVALPNRIAFSSVGDVLVLAFSNHDDEVYKSNFDYYVKSFPDDVVQMDKDHEIKIYQELKRRLSSCEGQDIKILIDYSSMTRGWYSAIINYFRNVKLYGSVTIHFVYASGIHDKAFEKRTIKGVSCLPGCEGGTIRPKKSIALLGLGFDSYAPFYVLDKLEADDIYAYIADPGVENGYAERAYEVNRPIIEEFIKEPNHLLHLPLRSVRIAFRYMTEVISPFLGSCSISFVPFGPKPHVLASILAALAYPEVSCLHVETSHSSPHPVAFSGEFVCTALEM